MVNISLKGNSTFYHWNAFAICKVFLFLKDENPLSPFSRVEAHNIVPIYLQHGNFD